jgi:hypothetical protein
MTFKTQMLADAAAVFFNTDEFADAGTFSSHDGTTTGATAHGIVEFDAAMRDLGAGQAQFATVHLLVSEVGDVKRYDEWTASDGTVWRVESVISRDEYVVTCSATRDRRLA